GRAALIATDAGSEWFDVAVGDVNDRVVDRIGLSVDRGRWRHDLAGQRRLRIRTTIVDLAFEVRAARASPAVVVDDDVSAAVVFGAAVAGFVRGADARARGAAASRDEEDE